MSSSLGAEAKPRTKRLKHAQSFVRVRLALFDIPAKLRFEGRRVPGSRKRFNTLIIIISDEVFGKQSKMPSILYFITERSVNIPAAAVADDDDFAPLSSLPSRQSRRQTVQVRFD